MPDKTGVRFVIWLRRIFPVALGALSALGFAPWDCWPLTLLSCALWLLLVHDAPTLRRVLAIGWLFGFGHFVVANLWIQQPFEFQDKMPAALGYLGVVLSGAYLAIYPMLTAGLAWRFASPAAKGDPAPRVDLAFVLVAGAAWIVTEWLRSVMLTGYPWDPLSVIWVHSPLVVGLAAWVGTYALSGLTLAASGLLLLIPRQRVLAGGAAALLIVAALVPYSVTHRPERIERPQRVVLAQPNLGEEVKPTDDYGENNFQALARLTGKPDPRHPRLILWPEGAIRFPVEDGYPRYVYSILGSSRMARTRMAALLGDNDAILTGTGRLLGLPVMAGTQAMYFDKLTEDMTYAANSVVVVRADARLHGRYDKAHLVPFGEYLPARVLLEAIGASRLVPGDVDFIPGPGPRTINAPGFGKVGMAVCYEVIFSGQLVDRAHRPDFIFNPSNDSWFGTLGPPAHLAQAQLRAVEEGLPVIRSTPTGISAVIAADGAILAALPMGKAAALTAPIPPAFQPTLFARLGNWLALYVAALLVICAIAIRRRAR